MATFTRAATGAASLLMVVMIGIGATACGNDSSSGKHTAAARNTKTEATTPATTETTTSSATTTATTPSKPQLSPSEIRGRLTAAVTAANCDQAGSADKNACADIVVKTEEYAAAAPAALVSVGQKDGEFYSAQIWRYTDATWHKAAEDFDSEYARKNYFCPLPAWVPATGLKQPSCDVETFGGFESQRMISKKSTKLDVNRAIHVKNITWSGWGTATATGVGVDDDGLTEGEANGALTTIKLKNPTVKIMLTNLRVRGDADGYDCARHPVPLYTTMTVIVDGKPLDTEVVSGGDIGARRYCALKGYS